MLEDVKGVIFDMDGTLIDSMWMWEAIDIEYLNRFELSLPDDLQRKIEGMSFTETAQYFKSRFQIQHTIEEMQRDWNEMAWQKYKEEVELKEGALEFLKHLKQLKVPCGIASSNSRELIELIIDRFDIGGYFQSVRNSCEAGQGKPAPDIYLMVASDLGVEPETCLVFEDVLQGVMGGKKAGMRVCNIYDEYSKSETEKMKRFSDYYIQDYFEILNGTYERLK